MEVVTRALLLASLLCLGAGFAAVHRLAWRRESRLRDALASLLLFVFTSLFLLASIELYLSINVKSDGYGFTLMGRSWSARNWKPLNSFGYRDKEHDEETLRAKKTLFVVGDSFVAGYGVVDPADRFPDLLQERLGPDWVVVNIAGNGWATADELQALYRYPVKPDAILLSYHMNDFGAAAQREGFIPPPFVEKPPKWLAPWLERSYLVDFCYWRMYRFLSMAEVESGWEQYILTALEMPEVWKRHRRELQTIIDYARMNDVKLMVVLFPFLADMEWTGSRRVIADVKRVFRSEGVEAIDLSEKLAGQSVRDLTVNSLDAHPNEKTHRAVSEILFDAIRRASW